MTINSSIIVSTPSIGWFLLPNSPLAKKYTLFAAKSAPAAPKGTPKTLFIVTSPNLTRPPANCNRRRAAGGEINLELGYCYGDCDERLQRLGHISGPVPRRRHEFCFRAMPPDNTAAG
jgi:hypothetical protein